MPVVTKPSAPADSRPCWICGQGPADCPVQGAAVSICSDCANSLTSPYDLAWAELYGYLRANWKVITAKGSFDLTKAFAGDTASQAIRVHLFFLKMLGCKLAADAIAVDLAPFADALRAGTPHPEVSLLVADSNVPAGRLLSYGSDVSVLRAGEEVSSALWVHLAHPIAVKICYLKSGAAVREPEGHPWHPSRQRKMIKLSPYKGDTQPLVKRRDLRI